ncbi:MAG: J domain-containing protein [Bryobacteraceae bacterium]
MNATEVFGLAENASDEEIRAAYLKKVKEHPPDRSPEEFERIRDAFETLRDPRRRIREMLSVSDPSAPLSSLFAGLEPERRFVGPGPWLEALKRA